VVQAPPMLFVRTFPKLPFGRTIDAESTESTEVSMSGCAVLVVDDDPTILISVAQTLELEGYPVAQAANGAEALAHVERNRVDVVLLDMRMPVLDGWGFMHAIRERGVDLKVVVMTAATDARRWAREVGATAHLPKPFDIDDVVRLIQQECAA
jgi:two-component system chemotaxis response regulator CheY